MISNPSTTQPSIFDKLELLKTGDNVARFNNCLLKKVMDLLNVDKC